MTLKFQSIALRADETSLINTTGLVGGKMTEKRNTIISGIPGSWNRMNEEEEKTGLRNSLLVKA